jgi:hypothetical protein
MRAQFISKKGILIISSIYLLNRQGRPFLLALLVNFLLLIKNIKAFFLVLLLRVFFDKKALVELTRLVAFHKSRRQFHFSASVS